MTSIKNYRYIIKTEGYVTYPSITVLLLNNEAESQMFDKAFNACTRMLTHKLFELSNSPIITDYKP